jgi:dihydropyrimidinase
VLVRGQVVVDNDELVASPGTGRFLRRARFGEKLAPTPKAGVS